MDAVAEPVVPPTQITEVSPDEEEGDEEPAEPSILNVLNED
jgi:hypothetical protein